MGNRVSNHRDGGIPAQLAPEEIASKLDILDYHIAAFMRAWGLLALRVSLALVFIWFGILKVLGLSPAEGLVLATVDWMPIFGGEVWLHIIGWWEVAIGITFLFQRTLRIAIALLAGQMVGTLLPLLVLPDVAFQAGRVPFAPSLEGQYIIKNVIIISAALVIGGSARRRRAHPGPEAPASPARS